MLFIITDRAAMNSVISVTKRQSVTQIEKKKKIYKGDHFI